MKLRVANLSARAFLLQGSLQERAEVLNFHFGRHQLSSRHLLDSAYASPGRYAAELLLRLQSEAPESSGWLVLNPRFIPSVDSVLAVMEVALASSASDDFVVLADRNGQVAGVLFRRPVERRDVLTLAAQSALDPELDRDFFAKAFGWKGRVSTVEHAEVGSPFANGFVESSFEPIAARLPTRLALEALAKLDPDERLQQIVVMPYHAGDVLFLAQAIQAHPAVDAVVTASGFADILLEAVPRVRTVAVNLAVNARRGFQVVNEQAQMVDVVRLARSQAHRSGHSLEGVFHLFRPHRDYSHSHYELRQQTLFALGAGCEESAEVWPLARAQRRHSRSTENRKRRVLLHLDGGWSLKSYPRAMRPSLVALLRSAGFVPFLFGSPDPMLEGVEAQPFQGLAHYRALLEDSVAVVGVDSFPAHYALNWGLPTLHLFGSTHPRNAGYPEGPVSAVLHRDMPCAPCNGDTLCKLDGGSACRAFVTPHEILERLSALVGGPSKAHDSQEGYAYEYAHAQRTVEAVKERLSSGRVLVVDCESGALVRRLCEQGFQAMGVSLDGDAARARRLSGIHVEDSLPSHERFDVVVAVTERAPPRETLLTLLAPAGALLTEPVKPPIEARPLSHEAVLLEVRA